METGQIVESKQTEIEVDGQKIYIPEIEQKYDFSRSFKICCRELKNRVRKDYDAVIAITGTEGVSKSTCANQIGFLVDKKYTFDRNVLFSPTEKDMVNLVRNLPRFAAINADEAIKILYKQQWWLQVFLNKFYRICRQENKISILCMPRFGDFNEGFRNHRIMLWIHLLDRGIGVAFEPHWSPVATDPWEFKEIDKTIKKYTKGKRTYQTSLEKRISILGRCDNCLGRVTFPDLSPEMRVQYKSLSALHKYEGLDEELSQTAQHRKMRERYMKRIQQLKDLLQKHTGMTNTQLSKELGLSKSTISDWNIPRTE